VAGASSNGINPQSFTLYGGKVLFWGQDTADQYGLWTTDGTSAGTVELSVTGASSNGLQPQSFTLYGGKVLFWGHDAANQYGLWTTDGTSAGTAELSVAGASSRGLNPQSFTPYDGKVLFQGLDAANHLGLWTTDGTAAGTAELAVAGAGGSYGLQPQSFTLYGGKVLFEGLDAADHYGLWTTDGTSAGTTELSVAGASSYGLYPQSFTLYGGKVLFWGQDTANHYGLWTTDGTSAGTTELSVASASSYGLQPQSLTALDITVRPTITALHATPSAAGPLGAGRTVSFTLTPSEAVTVNTGDGSPALALSNGGNATYAGQDTNGDLLFTTAVAPGQDTADLKVTGFVPGGAFVTDAAGSLLDASGLPALAGSDTGIVVDTIAPATPDAPALTSNNDSGVAGDGVTNVRTPTLSGTAEAGSTVVLSDAAGQLASTTAGTDGRWSVAAGTLADGTYAVTATATDAAGNMSASSQPFALTINATPPTLAALHAVPSAPGPLGAGRTVSFTLTPSEAVTVGTGNGSLPTLALSGGGSATYASQDSSGNLLFTATVAAGQDTADLKVLGLTLGGASVTDAAGSLLDASGLPALAGSDTGIVVDTIAPALTAAFAANPQDANSGGITYGQVLSGGGDPNAAVTISEGGHAIGTAQADAAGTWTYDPSGVAPGSHVLAVSEADAAGNTGTVPAVAFTVPDTRFSAVNVTASTSGSLVGSDYSGPVGYLQAEYIYGGTDDVVVGAKVANVFLKGGAGTDALAAKAGSNVLDGGAGSNWLVGASGADGGTDTFFVDGRGGQTTWDTLLNFHTGDMLTLWSYDDTTGSTSWSDNQGAVGYQGATLNADFGGGSGAHALVTFAGSSAGTAQFTASTGTAGGLAYLAVTRTA
jgi:ELWxxDGT repeat protein